MTANLTDFFEDLRVFFVPYKRLGCGATVYAVGHVTSPKIAEVMAGCLHVRHTARISRSDVESLVRTID